MHSLQPWREAGVFGALDLAFAQLILDHSPGHPTPELLALGAAASTRAPGAGHVCAQLERLAGQLSLDREGQPLPQARWPELVPWLDALRASPAVGDGSGGCPLVLDAHNNLYLRRLWAQQQQLATSLNGRVDDAHPQVDLDLLGAEIAQLFPRSGPDALQRVACAIGVTRRFAVISGGPGTGKTTTVAKLLVLLQQHALRCGPPMRMLLLAPTGKAAARLLESLSSSLASLPMTEEVRAHLPKGASTLHRALGWQPRTPTRFKHHAGNPLPADLVLVDEASMVDLSLMSKLVDAVGPAARLVLLGDQDQLASVEAGAILGDLCNAQGARPPWSGELLDTLSALGLPQTEAGSPQPGLQDHIVQLSHSFRFDGASGIGALSRAINAGDGPGVLEALGSEQHPDLHWERIPANAHPNNLEALRSVLRGGFQMLTFAKDPQAALALLARFRVLCAHRQGRWGVNAINRLCARILVQQGLIPAGEAWYSGRPVMVTRNDYALGLYNGDVGVALDSGDGQLRVWFPPETPGAALRAFHPARLPPHDTVFATTVHKSQGSEFAEVVLILPPKPSPLLTRELLYTGVTRAKERVEIYGNAAVLRAGVTARIQRASGLRAALWGPEC